MAIGVKHKFQSQLPDGNDPNLIRPSNWNDSHDMTMSGVGLVGRSTSGEGPVSEITPGTGLSISSSGELNAGTIAGRSLTVSSSAPSGGVDGDVHFQI